MTRAVENVLTARARLGESPLWDAERQRLYWVDIYNHRVHEFDPKTGGDRSFEVGDVVSPIALAGKNRLLMGQRNRLTTLDLQTGEVSLLVQLMMINPARDLTMVAVTRRGGSGLAP